MVKSKNISFDFYEFSIIVYVRLDDWICFTDPEKPIMKMLEARTGDREAQEFVRRLKEIEKSMEEE